MKNHVGFLIRNNRLKQNLSQESLSKGICVVSYLSKIENNKVEANIEIVQQIFLALGIEYQNTQDTKYDFALFKSYFETIFFGSDFETIVAEITAKGEVYAYSDLWCWYQLFLISEEHRQEHQFHDTDNPSQKLLELEHHLHIMDDEEKFWFYMNKGFFGTDNYEKITAFKKADECGSSYNSLYALAKIYANVGDYHESLIYCSRAYEKSCEDGNHVAMYHTSLLQGNCYAQLCKLDLMKKYYHRALKLGANYSNNINWAIHYNMGATLLQLGNYKESKHHLYMSEKLGCDKKTDFNNFLVHHKIAILHYRIGQKDKGRIFCEKARIDADKTEQSVLFHKMVDMLYFWEDESYLKNDLYMALVEELYFSIKRDLFYGLARFHQTYYIEALKYNRRYKEVVSLLEENASIY